MMANLTITPASVATALGPTISKTAGVAIAAGEVIYLDSATSTVKLADADALLSAETVGIALNSAAANQPVTYQSAGTITIGATVVPGTAYYVSSTAGSICLESDLASGDYVTLLGIATTTAIISINIFRSATAKA
jgi:surface antigen